MSAAPATDAASAPVRPVPVKPAYDDPNASASLEDWLAVLAGSLGALIASLDVSIVNSALPQIQGEIGASGTEGTWISTGYLVAETVMIPLTAWLARVFGMRGLLLGSTIMFTIFSVMCGFSHGLTSMTIGRVGQGFFGGALIPTAQTIMRTRLPLRQLPIGSSIFGMIVMLGPIFGPVVGGWLTENASWQWCFFLNLPVAGALITLLLLGLTPEKARMDQFIRGDWLGIVGLTTGIGCLTVVLEEGQRQRWFESDLISWLSVFAVLGFAAMLIAQFTARIPVIKLRLMSNPAYGSAVAMITMIGMVIYGIVYILPQFLNGIAHYNALQSGQVLFLSSLPALAMIIILPQLLAKVSMRLMVLTGLLCLGASCWIDVGMSPQTSGDDFTYSQFLRGFGQMLSFMPLSQASVSTVTREEAPDASALYNMARNLGGSIGLALIGVFIDRRVESHSEAISASVTANSPQAQSWLDGVAAGFMANGSDAATSQSQALAQLTATIHIQAVVLTYSECFWVLGASVFALVPLVLLLRFPRPNMPVRAR